MEIDVSPDMKFYNLLESYPYTAAGALCEYIDNALEAFQSARKNFIEGVPEKLKIDILLDDSSIIIRDYGVGISSEHIQRAMKPAYTPGKQSLSEFGIGMKAASMWFGRSWKLESFPVNEENSLSLSFDLDALLEQQAEEVELDMKDLNPNEQSGLRITLTKLNRQIDKTHAERIWEEIQEIYQFFTSREEPILTLMLKYKSVTFPKKDFKELKVTTPLEFPLCKFKDSKLYAIGDSIKWKKDINFEFDGKTVHGYISLGKEMSQLKNPGIRLFRFGRLIKGSEMEPYRPVRLVGSANKAAPSRFYAELHLDGQAISNSKGEFVFDEYLFLEALGEQEGVQDYIEQAENYRQRKVDVGDYIPFSSIDEFEKETGTKVKSKKVTSTPKKIKKKSEQVTSTLSNLSAPESFLLLDRFLDESRRLYDENRFWPFCMVYRAILEVSIIDKLKQTNEDHYFKVKEKSILGLYNYLHSNSHLIPDSYETLKKVLKQKNSDNEPLLGLLNLASHGRYAPTKPDVDDLLRNTQQLLEWAFDREGD